MFLNRFLLHYITNHQHKLAIPFLWENFESERHLNKIIGNYLSRTSKEVNRVNQIWSLFNPPGSEITFKFLNFRYHVSCLPNYRLDWSAVFRITFIDLIKRSFHTSSLENEMVLCREARFRKRLTFILFTVEFRRSSGNQTKNKIWKKNRVENKTNRRSATCDLRLLY